MTTPFAELQAYYGPSGVGAMRLRYHEEEQAWDLPDIKFLDTEHPLFKALWQEGNTNYNRPGEHPKWGYQPRRRAEAALRLLDALLRCGHAFVAIASLIDSPTPLWEAKVGGTKDTFASSATAATWWDALSAAILAGQKAP